MVTKGLLRSRQILLSFTKYKTLYKTTENPQILEWVLTRKTLKKQEKTLSNTFLQFSQKTKNTVEKKIWKKQHHHHHLLQKHLLLPHPTNPRTIIEIQAKPNWDWWGRERSKWVFGEGENASPREEEDNKNVVLWRRGEKRRGDLFNKTKKDKKNKSGFFFLLFSSRKWRAKETQSQPNTHHHSNLLSTTNNNLDLSTTILKPYFTRKKEDFSFPFFSLPKFSLLFSSQKQQANYLFFTKERIIFSHVFPKRRSKFLTLCLILVHFFHQLSGYMCGELFCG